MLKFIPAISPPSPFGRRPIERRLIVFYSNCFINSTREKIQPTFQMKAERQGKILTGKLATHWIVCIHMSRDLGHKNCKPMHDIDIYTRHCEQDQPIFYMNR